MLSTITMVGIMFLSPIQNPIYIGVGIALYSFFTMPILPLSLELCLETTFPAGEASAAGLVSMMSQLIAIGGVRLF